MPPDTLSRPSVARIVHYVAPGSADGTYPPAHRAAIITKVLEDETVILTVLSPTGMHIAGPLVPDHSDEPAPYTWHWPEREG